MSNRITLGMTIAVLGGFAIILLMNIAALMGFIPAKYISPNDVRGMAVEHDHVLYTLNFAQQNTLIDIFNRTIPVSPEVVETRKTTMKQSSGVQKIIIYRFNAPDIEIRPVAYVKKSSSAMTQTDQGHGNIVFSVPEWNRDGLLEEAASDETHNLLLTTYDH